MTTFDLIYSGFHLISSSFIFTQTHTFSFWESRHLSQEKTVVMTSAENHNRISRHQISLWLYKYYVIERKRESTREDETQDSRDKRTNTYTWQGKCCRNRRTQSKRIKSVKRVESICEFLCLILFYDYFLLEKETIVTQLNMTHFSWLFLQSFSFIMFYDLMLSSCWVSYTFSVSFFCCVTDLLTALLKLLTSCPFLSFLPHILLWLTLEVNKHHHVS